MHTTSEIRATFLDFFKKVGHTEISSSPLIPHNDPTLLFTAAGMVQFKDVFTGAEKRAYSRATTAQKCLRAGGKHNDLDNVGYTARHHTFFEMLGNFSFGDYFKEEAIDFAWTFVTKELGLSPERLLVTVYAEDEEAASIWRKRAGLPDHKIIRIATSDNFWSMGDTGPCGPCSEIFFDHGPAIAGGPPGSAEQDGDRFVEIWNLVFMQYEQMAGINGAAGQRVLLPKPSIDTGMGLERISAILQKVHSTYEIDLFSDLIHASVELTGVEAKGGALPSHRIIADHLRAMCFLIADGVLPSNEGRGYVLRRIMRRAMRHAHLLGAKDPIIHRLAPVLCNEMGGAYPELIRAAPLMTETLRLEEVRFLETLERGMRLLHEATSKLFPGQALSGDVAFKLYDTYGFPLDLTQDVLRGENRAVDLDGFNTAMQKQKAEARAAWVGSGDTKTESIWYDLREKNGTSDFLGYATLEAEGIVTALVQGGVLVEEVSGNEPFYILTNQTPFYGESGGQMGDMGSFSIVSSDVEVSIKYTQKKLGDLIVHEATLKGGALKIGDAVLMKVDAVRRQALRANHSATHLLHAALRLYLGEHVVQKGSLVAADRLRFDFSYTKALTESELLLIERWVNAQIRANTSVATQLMPPDQAMKSGAMALFGEKYGDEVRVVSMGKSHSPDKAVSGKPTSVELCGGTHVNRTGDIGSFIIVQESSIASGVRRLEALTGEAAEFFIRDQITQLKQVGATLKTSPDTALDRINTLVSDKKRLEKEVQDLRQKGGGFKGVSLEETLTISGVKLLKRQFRDIDTKDLRSMADAARKQLGSGVVVVTVCNAEKISLVIGVSADLTNHLSAVDLVRTAVTVIGGQGGGGRPDLAQAGGSGIQNLPALFETIELMIASKMGNHQQATVVAT